LFSTLEFTNQGSNVWFWLKIIPPGKKCGMSQVENYLHASRKKSFNSLHANPTCPKPGTSKTGFWQVKIMKEFVWINNYFFLYKFGFWANRWKKIKAKTALISFILKWELECVLLCMI
jgi:hypothetical protein